MGSRRNRGIFIGVTCALAVTSPLVTSCDSPSPGSFGVSESSTSSSAGGVGKPGGFVSPPSEPGFPPGKPDFPTDVPIPFVACIPPEGTPDPVDAGPDASPSSDASTTPSSEVCDVPPPDECLSSRFMVQYQPGYCDIDRCRFSKTILTCKGGCYEQLDGGQHCNR